MAVRRCNPKVGSRCFRNWAPNYLGTINNLEQVVTKTAAQTMKIVYTLTDIDATAEEPEE